MNEKFLPNFLENTPKGQDLFEGKSQEKIAGVLVDILQKDNFQIIGIDGGWGTGKSNLVWIVKGKLSKSNFFIYDVWGHQEDDQRRSILIELTDYITSEKIVSTHKWEEKLKRLLSKQKEVTTINRPYLSIGFIFSLFSIIYIPTVNTFKDSLFFDIKMLFWKLLLVLFPIVIVAGIYLYNLIKFWYTKNKFGRSFILAAQETFQIYTNKQQEETKIETISENEPSVKDFRNWMTEIDKDLGNKKLIIVFDNFDRLPKKNILSIWSSIHIFFSDNKYKNIKVIIPFDRLHIKNAFKELNGDTKDFADDYINKTFDLVYRVSAPMLSDWKGFFRNRWSEAFGTIDEAEYLRVEQIYEVFKKTITPREIIAFINEVLSIKLLDTSIPDRYISLFVVNKEIILSDPLKAITEADFLSGLSYQYKDDENFQKYITALTYQISSHNALEIVYRKQLKDCLINKKSNEFIEISRTDIFAKIISPILEELENFENPILVLSEIPNDAKVTEIQRQSIWSNIYEKNKNGEIKDFEIKDYQKILIVNIAPASKQDYIKKIITNLADHKEFDAVQYATIIDSINVLIQAHSLDVAEHEFLPARKINVEKFIPLINEKRQDYKRYKLFCDETELDKYLADLKVENIDDGNFIQYLINDYKFPSYEASLRKKFDEQKSNYNNLSKICYSLKLISTKTIGSSLTDAEVYSLFTSSESESDFYYDLIAIRLSKGPNFHNSYQPIFENATEKQDQEFVEKISSRIEYFIDYDDFLLNSLKFNGGALYKAVVQKITSNSNERSRANILSLLEKFDDICHANELDPQAFIQKLDLWELMEEIKEVSKFPIRYFEEAMKSDTELAKSSIKVIKVNFDKLNKEEWLAIFTAMNDKKFKLLQTIDYKGWNSFAVEALKEFLISITKSTKISHTEKISNLINQFEAAEKNLTNTFKDIRDEYISNRNMTPDSFNLFQSWFFKYAALEERPKEVIRTIIRTNLLDDERCVSALINHNKQIQQLIKACNNDDLHDLEDGIRDRSDREPIQNLANLLGIGKNA